MEENNRPAKECVGGQRGQLPRARLKDGPELGLHYIVCIEQGGSFWMIFSWAWPNLSAKMALVKNPTKSMMASPTVALARSAGSN